MSRQRDITPLVQPEMNVTPLVDVVLVLLIVFMVIAPQLQHDVPVALPGVVHPDASSAAGSEALQVSLTAAGEVYVEGQRYAREQLTSVLQAAHAADPLRRMAVRADERVIYNEVRTLCADAQKIGFPGVALMVGERRNRPVANGE